MILKEIIKERMIALEQAIEKLSKDLTEYLDRVPKTALDLALEEQIGEKCYDVHCAINNNSICQLNEIRGSVTCEMEKIPIEGTTADEFNNSNPGVNND